MHPWRPGEGYLYELDVELWGDALVDAYTLAVGIRTVEVDGTRFLINGEPFHFHGFGKHEDSAVRGKGHDDAFMVHDFALMEWIGANSFRTSHYPYAEEVLDYADRHGIVVIDETAAVGMNMGISIFGTPDAPTYSADTVNDATQAVHRQAIRELVARDKNHPCVVLWSIANEPESNTPEARAYFEPLAAETRRLDPTRPVSFTNMMLAPPERDVVADLFDVVMLNRYYGWYEHPGDLAAAERGLEAELNAWAAKLGKPIIITEYGADVVAGHARPPLGAVDGGVPVRAARDDPPRLRPRRRRRRRARVELRRLRRRARRLPRRRQQEGRLHARPQAQERRPRPAAALAGSDILTPMNLRTLGKTGRDVSEIGFGAWQIGADWGEVDEDAAMATLHAAADAGVTFFDTADVYGDGRSERLVGRLLREREGITVATKMGRRMDQTVENYSPEHFREWNDRSRENLGVDTLDLVQLHCPPTDLYYHPEVFEDLEAMVGEGRIAAYGVSVERVEEALKAIEYPNVATVQIIFNAFRQRPAGLFFAEAARRGVGDHRARAARVRPAVGQVHPRHGVRRGRPPQLQPPGRGVRRRRDVRGRAVRGRPRRGRGAAPAGAGGRDARPVRAALDPDARRRLDGHPRRALARAGAGQRRGGRAAGARRRRDGAHRGGLRRADRSARPSALVGRLRARRRGAR